MIESLNKKEIEQSGIYAFIGEVLELANKFFNENGKWPNELRLGERWQDAYEKIVENYSYSGFFPSSPYESRKHWWFMGMRVFYEIWTHGVDWSEETELLKKKG